MKLPFPTTTTTTTNNQIISSPSEPNSVLDLRRSPSPPFTHPNPDSDSYPITADYIIDSQSDDFDSLMREWSFQDDPTKPFSELVDSDGFSDIPITNNNNENDNNNNNNNNNNLSEFPPNSWFDYGLLPEIPAYTTTTPPMNINPNFDSFDNPPGEIAGLDYVDELIRLAECLETNSLQLGHEILARLNQRLGSPSGKPLQRSAFYFKEALQSLLTTGSARPAHRAADTFEIVQTIKAQKTFSSVSPIPMFAGFAANQAVLEALDGGGYDRVHVIDFEIGLGGHWASFVKDLAERAGTRRDAPPPSLRVSAVVQEGYAAESRLVGENLAAFAREVNVRFDVDFVLVRTFEYLSFEAFKFVDGERVAVVLSPAIFRDVGTGFLSELRRVSPHVVVHVDAEGQMGYGTASYRQAVIDGLEFYSTLLESLEATNFNGGGDWTRRIETFVVYPKIAETVEAAGGRRGMGWREALAAAGLRQVGLSQFSEFQAVCLLRRVQIRGFHVAKRQAEMLLCWHDRPLVATSAWKY